MADTPNTPEALKDAPQAATPSANFLNDTTGSVKSEDTLYNDFFQETGGEMTLWTKKERSGLEVLVNILEWTTIFVVVIGSVMAIHVFVRTMNNVSFLESYSFICPYLNYDIEGISDTEKWCKNIDTIEKEFSEKKVTLEANIIDALTEYIPIRVSSSILDASPEKKFIIDTFQNKPRINNVLEAFEQIKSTAQKNLTPTGNETTIQCTGISVTNGNTLSTQCTIYGGDIGNSNTNGQLGSARVEALDFIEKISDTTKSSLILNSYPTSLSIETVDTQESREQGYSTRTTIPINVTYIPLTEKI